MRKITRRTLLLGSASGLHIAPWALDTCVGQQNNPRPRELNPSDQEWAAIKAVSNVFEVGNPEPAFAYVEALRDARGYTATQYGFCTYNDEISSIIERIASSRPATPLRQFLPYLPAADAEIPREPMPFRIVRGKALATIILVPTNATDRALTRRSPVLSANPFSIVIQISGEAPLCRRALHTRHRKARSHTTVAGVRLRPAHCGGGYLRSRTSAPAPPSRQRCIPMRTMRVARAGAMTLGRRHLS